MIGPVKVYIIQNGERQPGLYYLYKSEYSHGIASTGYVMEMASPEDRERIINESMYESPDALFNHIDHVNNEEVNISGPPDYIPYTVEMSFDMFTNQIDEMVNL